MFVRTSTTSSSTNGWIPGWPPVQSAGLYSPNQTPYEQSRRTDSVTVEVLLTPTINGKRSLEIRLIDSIDPFFMWHASLSEEDYFVLKREQSLLIDFGRFPYKLIELLQACVTHGREEHPVYAAWLGIGAGSEDGRRPADATLTITEATTFRQVPHLTLRFGAVNDSTMRKHLAEMLRQYKDEVDGLRSRLYTGSATATATAASYPNVMGGESYQSLKERCRMLEEHVARLETSSRFPSMPGPSPSQPQQQQQQPTGMQFQPRPANMSAMEAQLMGLETLVKERNLEIVRLNNLIQTLSDQKRELEKNLEEGKTKDSALQQSKEEISKANEIIKKLQDEIKQVKNRLKSSESFNRQHEKLTRDSQLTFDALRSELTQLKATHSTRLADLEACQQENKTLTAKVKDLETKLEENQRVTDYLHAELNQKRIDEGNDTLSPQYWARQAALLTQLPPGEETSY